MALINLRNALMTGKPLPYDAEVEYLESTGTQWIDSGIIGAPDVIVEATFAWGDGAFAADNTLIGSNTGSNRFIPITTNNQSGVEIGTGSSWTFAVASIKYAKNTVYTARSEFVSGAIKFVLDGTQVISTTKAISNTNLVMYIFASRESSVNRKAHAKLYSMKIYVNGVLVRNFIPVRKGTVGYLYDRVSGKLFGNAGTGDFVLGPDVVPVKYIESHGTEWIDTGLPCVDGYTFKANFLMTSLFSTYNYLAGSGAGSSNRLYFTRKSKVDNSFRCTYNDSPGSTYTDVGTNQRISVTTVAEMGNQSVAVNGQTIYSASVSTPVNTGLNIYLFAATLTTSATGVTGEVAARVWSASFEKDSALVRSFRPVRVGSGSTWEGAMMDVLTRRIYRNAGTGAFTYGNDLKYPIPSE